MERMEEVVPECDYQSLQHFLSHSDWKARAVLNQVAVEADHHLGGSADSCLLIDESSFQKKGDSRRRRGAAMVRPAGQGGELPGGGFCLPGAGDVFDLDRHPFVTSPRLDRGP
jgi:DDE superfamily endonuclease